ncbi:MAG: hypothetical protein ACI8RU_000306 [Zhongshania aliphaticivorans]|jgi:hypothetical protein|uniref:hypothetical protein n=1 Tax=Zhongshania aliphaticivorans TaxID=1470434 RepID=UPI0039E70A06
MLNIPMWKSKSAIFSTTISIVLLSSGLTILPAQAGPEFSNAHKKIERAIETAASKSPVDAMWLRHDALLIAVDKDKTNAKNYAKGICEFLAENGFAAQHTSVVITDQAMLRKRNQVIKLSERRCD